VSAPIFVADAAPGGCYFAGARLRGAGDLRIHAGFRSRFLQAERDIIVYLPPGYEEQPERSYPVIYLQDGQNLFDGATSFVPGQDWRVGQTTEELIRARAIRPLIIVGVGHAGRERVDEYTPTFDARFNVGGKAELYGRLLIEELKPFVDARYRTHPAAENTGLGGSSLGGLVSLYLGLKYPTIFGRLAVMSPSVWWGGGAILREVSALASKPEMRIWLDTGTEEGEPALRNVRFLRDGLRQKGWRNGQDLNYFEDVGAGHSENAWAARLGSALKYLYPPDPTTTQKRA
jgi:predicted alpha/beta superfamily hydrolase